MLGFSSSRSELVFRFYACSDSPPKVENMRNNKLKSVRESWSHSKFFIGKNRVLSKALGGTEAEEYAEGLSMLAKCLRNECGLLATNQARAEVEEYFGGLEEPDFARTGGTATETVVLDKGPLPEFSHSMEPQVGPGVINQCLTFSPLSCGSSGCRCRWCAACRRYWRTTPCARPAPPSPPSKPGC